MTQPELVCPHCQVKGEVVRMNTPVRAGYSLGKVVAAVLTAGISALVVGVSREQTTTEMWCANCETTWHVE